MGVKEILDGLKEKAAVAVTAATEHAGILATLGMEIDAEMKAERSAGFDEGLAQVAAPGDKVFSNEEMEAELQPLRDDIASLKGQLVASDTKVATLEGQAVDLQAELAASKELTAAEVEAAAKGAVESFKADVRAKYAEQQVLESAAEAELAKAFDIVE